jgi:hypothetical protein
MGMVVQSIGTCNECPFYREPRELPAYCFHKGNNGQHVEGELSPPGTCPLRFDELLLRVALVISSSR